MNHIKNAITMQKVLKCTIYAPKGSVVSYSQMMALRISALPNSHPKKSPPRLHGNDDPHRLNASWSE